MKVKGLSEDGAILLAEKLSKPVSDIGLGHYTLDNDHQLVPATLLEWGEMMEDHDRRRVGKDEVGDVSVSTVFLGVNHGFGSEQLYFETMCFGGEYDQVLVARYATWDDAVNGHRSTVTRLKAGYDPVA